MYLDAAVPITGVSIYNEQGRQVYSHTNDQGITTIQIENLASGFYFLKCTTVEGIGVMRKLVKK